MQGTISRDIWSIRAAGPPIQNQSSYVKNLSWCVLQLPELNGRTAIKTSKYLTGNFGILSIVAGLTKILVFTQIHNFGMDLYRMDIFY
jgi:hypothetical protein